MIINVATLAQFNALSALFSVERTPTALIEVEASPEVGSGEVFVSIELSGHIAIAAINAALGSEYPVPSPADKAVNADGADDEY